MTDFDEVFGAMAMGDIFTCPVCRDVYNTSTRLPMNIPCGHSLCCACTKTLIGERKPESLMCPVCRKNHYTEPGKIDLNFPKNFQLVDVMEKMIDVKTRVPDVVEDFMPLLKCRECIMEVPEFELTQCKCVKAPRSNDVDFMKRQKNSLICTMCIESKHEGHDFKPFSTIRTAWDCRNAKNDLDKITGRVWAKFETAERSLDNAKQQIAELRKQVNKTCTRLHGRPTSETLRNLSGELYKKIEKMGEVVSTFGVNTHSFTTAVNKNISMVKNYGLRPPRVRTPNAPPPPPGLPAGPRNEGLIEFHFQMQLNDEDIAAVAAPAVIDARPAQRVAPEREQEADPDVVIEFPQPRIQQPRIMFEFLRNLENIEDVIGHRAIEIAAEHGFDARLVRGGRAALLQHLHPLEQMAAAVQAPEPEPQEPEPAPEPVPAAAPRRRGGRRAAANVPQRPPRQVVAPYNVRRRRNEAQRQEAEIQQPRRGRRARRQ